MGRERVLGYMNQGWIDGISHGLAFMTCFVCALLQWFFFSVKFFNVLRKYISTHCSVQPFFCLFGYGANALNFCHVELIYTVYMFGFYRIISLGYVGDLREANRY